MKRTLLLCLLLFLTHCFFGQTPGVKWINYYHTMPISDVTEAFFDAKLMPDKGYILAGFDTFYSYNKNEYLKKYSADSRARLIRVDKDGTMEWEAFSFEGGGIVSSFASVNLTSGDKIIAAGYANAPTGPDKFYIAKYDDNGTQAWYKTYGGLTGISRAYSIQETSDAGYIVAGMTTSNDGDVNGNHNAGTSDVWILKLDGSGNIQWKKCYGGSGDDTAYAIIQTPDNGFVVAGSSTSSNGDLTGNNGSSDAWVFKIDNAGNLIWQKNIGGSSDEDLKSIVLNSDTTFTVTGTVSSSTITNNGNYGKKDLWVIKIKDDSGQEIWSKNFGGTGDEQGYSIQRTVGNGYLIGGYTESNDGDIQSNNGGADAWSLKLTPDGDMIWQKCMGTNKDDFGMSALYSSQTEFAMAGYSEPVSPQDPYDLADAFLSRLGNTNTIKALLYNDANQNGIKDAGEEGFNEALVIATKAGFERSAVPQNGIVSIDADLGTYTTSVQVNSPYYNIVPASQSSNFPNYFNTDSFSFAVQPVPNKRDLVISIVPLGSARPGIFDNFKIVYKNIGTDIAGSGEIIFKHDDRLSFSSASSAISSSNGDTLKWSYSNLEPFDSASITVFMQVLPPPAVNLGDTLVSLAFITSDASDVTPNDDTAFVKQRIVGSFDPNDKVENNGGIIGPDYITDGKYLDYTIRFQNTGTAIASNVIVRDTLSDKLDWSTLQMVASSHPYTVSITGQNKIEWTFSSINLPDSNTNEPGSHGFIAYRVKPKSTVLAGDTIHNNASIYFDFNFPVATNNAFTVVKSPNIALPVHLLDFTGVRHNDQAILHWSTVNEDNFEKFEIARSANGTDYSVIGASKANGGNTVTNYEFTDDLTAVSGNLFYYRLTMIDLDGGAHYSKVVLIRKDEKVIKGIHITPNPVWNSQATVTMNSAKKGTIELRVIDMTGQYAMNQVNYVTEGKNIIVLNNIDKLLNGIYILQINNGENIFITKFEVIR